MQIQIVSQTDEFKEKKLFKFNMDEDSIPVKGPFIAFLMEKAETYEALVLSVKKTVGNIGGPFYTLAIMTPSNQLVNPDAIMDKDYFIKLRKTRLEDDGNIYQLLISTHFVADGKCNNDLIFTMNGQNVFNAGSLMFRVFREVEAQLVIKQMKEI